MGEGLAVARTIVNELDAARFDPLLARSVARNVVNVLNHFTSRISNMVSVLSQRYDFELSFGQVAKDRPAYSLSGPVGSPQQLLNIQLTSAVYHCWARLEPLESEYPPAVVSIITPAVKVSVHSMTTAVIAEMGARNFVIHTKALWIPC